MNKPQDNLSMGEALIDNTQTPPKTTELTLQQVNAARALALQSNRHALDVLEESGITVTRNPAEMGKVLKSVLQ